jgi:lipopolysaccharide/colanic/teichoic acid biosynthesis glycosyltransferase
MRKQIRLGIDLALVGLSPFLALFIRDNYDSSVDRLQGVIPYALLCLIAALIVTMITGLHQRVWRYTSLTDALHLIAASSAALLIALSASFVLNRSEGVARSLPAIQWLLLVPAVVGSRIAVRLWAEQTGRKRGRSKLRSGTSEHVLIVGINDLTELYLRSVAEFAPAHFSIVGILSRERELRGRLMRLYKILGTPNEALQIIAQLEIHGIIVERLIVMQAFEQLSREEQQALLMVEQSSDIKVDWLVERLGLREGDGSSPCNRTEVVSVAGETQLVDYEQLTPPRYHGLKRGIDVIVSSCLLVMLAPAIALVALLIAVDVGFPLVFWQQRPGWKARPFRLFKFRTMRAAHDAQGNRVPDGLRSSHIGRFLQKSRLDELPQLYNILVGEMSLVGPRPLLPVDQPEGQSMRLLVRPGLTGWAQINGGRDISPKDKAALDVWYIMHASLRLDLAIILRSVALLVLGERVNDAALNAAHARLQEMRAKPAIAAASSDSTFRQPSVGQKAA